MKAVIVVGSFLIAGSATAVWLAGVASTSYSVAQPTRSTSSDSASRRVIRGVGYVEPTSDIRKLTFKVEGVIDKCPVQIGQPIEAGEIVATLRSHDEQAAVTVAEKDLAVAKAEREKLLSGIHPCQIEAAKRRVARLEVHVRHAQQDYTRHSNLLDRHVTSGTDYDQAKTTVQQGNEELLEAKADLEHLQTHVRAVDKILAEARVQLAEANVMAAMAHLQNTIVFAPFRGTVLEILKQEGEAVRVYDSQPVLVFANIEALRVRAEVDERYVSLIQIGQAAAIYGHSLGSQKIQGTVTLLKRLMGNKTVFTREASERKDLDVLQVFITPNEPLHVPVGLKVEVEFDPAR